MRGNSVVVFFFLVLLILALVLLILLLILVLLLVLLLVLILLIFVLIFVLVFHFCDHSFLCAPVPYLYLPHGGKRHKRGLKTNNFGSEIVLLSNISLF